MVGECHWPSVPEWFSDSAVRVLGGLATVVVALGVAGSVLRLVTSMGPEEALVLVVGVGVLWLTVVLGIRGVMQTETAYW